MGKNEKKIAVYSRKSKFTGKGESIENQVELCREYIRVHYGEIEQEQMSIFEDEGFSGGNLNRPAFQKMMDGARKRKFKAIVVYRLDRISRNISDFAGLIEELSHLDIAFVSIKEQFDTGTPMGRAMMYVSSIFSQLERETIAERIRDNMHELAKTGRWLGGTTPTGYESEVVKTFTFDGKEKRSCRLKLVPAEAEVIRIIYALYREHDSLTITESELIRLGVRTKNDKYFTRFSIKAILQNPVYMIADLDAYAYFQKAGTDLSLAANAFDGVHGIMAYNRTNQESGKTTELLPPKAWIIAVGQHLGIISGKTWTAVQESLERNKDKNFRKPRSNEALLTGVLYCRCGSRMYPKLGRRKKTDEKPSYTYVCKMKERSRGVVCNERNVDGNTLDQAVMEELTHVEVNCEKIIEQLERCRRNCTEDCTEQTCRQKKMQNERQELEKRIEGLVDSLANVKDGRVITQVEKRIEKLNQEYVKMEERIHEAEKQMQQVLQREELVFLSEKMTELGSEMDEITVGQKRNIVRALIYKIVWDGTYAHVFLRGTQEEENVCERGWCEDSK